MRICYVFASRTRPIKFFDILDKIKYLSESDNYFVWAKLDNDDPFKEEYEKQLHEYPEVTVKWGLSKNKIHAINRDLEDLPECDIIVMQSDDVVWDAYGFDTEIREAFKKHFPNLDGTVHFPDSHAKDRTITVSILGINLYKKIGHLYHPDYVSVFADNHFTEMTRLMGKYVFINKRIMDHHHPIWGMTTFDEQYKKTESPEFYKKDQETFLKHKADNFGIK